MDNYSYETSLPAYQDNPSAKVAQAARVLNAVERGKNNLLAISEFLGLAQSTVSGRVNDLIEAGSLRYDGFVIYQDRKRKQIVKTPTP